MEKHPWKGLKLFTPKSTIAYCQSQNGKTSLEGFETSVIIYFASSTSLMSEWKNIPGRV